MHPRSKNPGYAYVEGSFRGGEGEMGRKRKNEGKGRE